MSDDVDEGSAAMLGSVAGGPVAWAVLDSRGTVCVAYTCREAAEAYCEGTFNRMAPLYRQPQDGVVRLPPLDPNGAPGWNAAIGAVREALADAGVDWDTE